MRRPKLRTKFSTSLLQVTSRPFSMGGRLPQSISATRSRHMRYTTAGRSRSCLELDIATLILVGSGLSMRLSVRLPHISPLRQCKS